MFGRVATAAALVALVVPASASAAVQWNEGPIAETSILSCLQEIPEAGTGAFLAYYADPAHPPQTGDVYYIAVVVSGLGNNCAGTIFYPEVTLPAGTSTAVSASTPLICRSNSHDQNGATAVDNGMCAGVSQLAGNKIEITCPPAWAGSLNNVPIAPGFPIGQGYTEEMDIPVVSSQPLAQQAFVASILTTDSGGQTLSPYVNVTVDAGSSSSPTTTTATTSTTTHRTSTSISFTIIPPTWTVIRPTISTSRTATSTQTTQTTVTQVTSTAGAPPTPQPSEGGTGSGATGSQAGGSGGAGNGPGAGVAGVATVVPAATVAPVSRVRVHGRTLTMTVPARQSIRATFSVCHRGHCSTKATISRSAAAGKLRIALPHRLRAGHYRLTVVSGSPARTQVLAVKVGAVLTARHHRR